MVKAQGTKCSGDGRTMRVGRAKRGVVDLAREGNIEMMISEQCNR